VFTSGPATPIGDRLWLYSNFHCNLACSYCCAESSPQASARLLPLDVALDAADEFFALGGRELFVTGGEPFLHPQIEVMITELARRLPVTVLTNAMTFHGGRRQLDGTR
jgi:MoaA/NifB/PqqE/SkfB family radical SAM enzyme